MASTGVDAAFQQRFEDDFREAYQRKTSLLRASVDTDFSGDGSVIYFDFVGKAKVRKRTATGERTQHNPPPFSRRLIRPGMPSVSDAYLSNDDIKKIGRSPQNKWMASFVAAHERNTDDVIISAAFGSSIAADENFAETAIALPASQKIAVAATGLTYAKVLATKTMHDRADVPSDERYAVIDPAQEGNLLTIAQATSSDYIGPKPVVVDGKIDTWLGYKFRTTNQLPLDGSGNRLCLFYQRYAIGLWVPMDITSDVGKDPGRMFDYAMVTQMNLAATRIFEDGVVQVACQES